MRGCAIPGCLCLAKWSPQFQVRLPGNDNPFRLDFDNIGVCDNHKSSLTLDDIMTPKTLETIQTLFKNTFLEPPKKENMKLEWQVDSFTTILEVVDSNGKKLGVVTDIRNKNLSKKA